MIVCTFSNFVNVAVASFFLGVIAAGLAGGALLIATKERKK